MTNHRLDVTRRVRLMRPSFAPPDDQDDMESEYAASAHSAVDATPPVNTTMPREEFDEPIQEEEEEEERGT